MKIDYKLILLLAAIKLATILAMLALVVIGVLIFNPGVFHEQEEKNIISSDSIPMPCEEEYNAETQDWVSVGCREECGCEVLAEYNIMVDVDNASNVISSIINNRSNVTWQK